MGTHHKGCLLIFSPPSCKARSYLMSVPTDPPPAYEYAVRQPPPVLPPGYQVAATLPSYQQAELDKEKLIAGNDVTDQHRAAARESSVERGEWELEDDMDLALLGTDMAFFTSFLAAFLFNWIGFLLLMCFCHTIAARYGALSGFGLSLAKWTLIVKNSTDLASADNSWLWWLITAFGMLVCMRAIFQYLHIKRTWGRLSTSARERLFFFY